MTVVAFLSAKIMVKVSSRSLPGITTLEDVEAEEVEEVVESVTRYYCLDSILLMR